MKESNDKALRHLCVTIVNNKERIRLQTPDGDILITVKMKWPDVPSARFRVHINAADMVRIAREPIPEVQA